MVEGNTVLFASLPLGFILLMVFCVFWCGRKRSSNDTFLPPDEAQKMIDSMQGDWNVILTEGRRMPLFERMTVTGNVMARLTPADGHGIGQNVSILNDKWRPTIFLQPRKEGDGTLILDSYGSKAIVFTPELGRMETELKGWNLKWSKVGFQGNLEQGQPLAQQPQAQQPQAQQPLAQQPQAPSDQEDVADKIQRLHQLKVQGALTEEEFSAAKMRILNSGQSSGGPSAPYDQPPPDLEAGFFARLS